ncbi:MAG TPA: class I SAM-dependent methyltransferase [Thermoanaerobaculia bacterium]|nr:class I SAM-dependent methyltransferase [Thermoanaerobaculia bacterium]
MAEDFLSRTIKEYYESPGVSEDYVRRTGLHPAERSLLERLAGDMEGETVLDIGVGPGRTLPWVRAMAGLYVGIDYSPRMLAPGRERFPNANLLLCDARSTAFADGTFGAVFFWNALDDVGHQDRLRILREVHRVLKPGGAFAFGIHNLDADLRSPWSLPGLTASGGLAAALRENAARWKKWAAGLVHHLRTWRHQKRGRGYAILGDDFFNFSLLTYYVTLEEQIRQLNGAGFPSRELMARDGTPIAPGERRRDAWIFFLARRS